REYLPRRSVERGPHKRRMHKKRTGTHNMNGGRANRASRAPAVFVWFTSTTEIQPEEQQQNSRETGVHQKTHAGYMLCVDSVSVKERRAANWGAQAAYFKSTRLVIRRLKIVASSEPSSNHPHRGRTIRPGRPLAQSTRDRQQQSPEGGHQKPPQPPTTRTTTRQQTGSTQQRQQKHN
ncbi:unnamed protein product, partial [Ectocarpus sp. 13 AM-2016]